MSTKSVTNLADRTRWIFTFTDIPSLSARTKISKYDEFKLGLTRITIPSFNITPLDYHFGPYKTTEVVDTVDFDSINADFIVDEDLGNYLKLLGWVLYISNNKDVLPQAAEDFSSVGILNYYDNWGNLKCDFTFYRLYPISIGELSLDYQATEQIDCNIMFRFDYMDYQTH